MAESVTKDWDSGQNESSKVDPRRVNVISCACGSEINSNSQKEWFVVYTFNNNHNYTLVAKNTPNLLTVYTHKIKAFVELEN